MRYFVKVKGASPIGLEISDETALPRVSDELGVVVNVALRFGSVEICRATDSGMITFHSFRDAVAEIAKQFS